MGLQNGPCCQLNGTCAMVTQENCEALGGLWKGDEFDDCQSAQCGLEQVACCREIGGNDLCVSELAFQCLSEQGEIKAYAPTCDGINCQGASGNEGACCLPDGSCADGLDSLFCASTGGTFYPGLTCESVQCDGDVSGACCQTDGSCFEASEMAECESAGGTFHVGVECNEAPCLQPLDCRGPREPFWLEGDYRYSDRVCETAYMGWASRPEEHEGDGTQFEPYTTAPTRSSFTGGEQCRRHYGVMWVMPDGTIQPGLYSCPDNPEDATIGLGYFAVYDTPAEQTADGVIPMIVPTRNPRPIEVIFFSEARKCRAIQE